MEKNQIGHTMVFKKSGQSKSSKIRLITRYGGIGGYNMQYNYAAILLMHNGAKKREIRKKVFPAQLLLEDSFSVSPLVFPGCVSFRFSTALQDRGSSLFWLNSDREKARRTYT